MGGKGVQKKEIVAMLLAGGQGSRLGILTKHIAKPAVAFGGKYKIIDFPLSNCINSGIDTVGVLTQYQPLKLNRHIGIGIPWDLDRSYGGVTILPPYVSDASGAWYSGTANAVFQNIPFMDYYDPEYVLILSGDHIYKMDYEMMLNCHKKKNADATIAVLKVPLDEAHRFGIMNTGEDNKIVEFEEKPKNPKNDLASMGIYIFNWKVLKQALLANEKRHDDSDFGKHIIPSLLKKGNSLYAYEFDGFWKDVGTLEAYWQANMELINIVPEFNLYEPYWKIYTKNAIQPPQFIGSDANLETCILGDGTEIYGEVYNSVIGSNVTIGKGTVIKNSIIMSDTKISDNCYIDRTIIAEECNIGDGVKLGYGDYSINKELPNIYESGLTVIGEKTFIPNNVVVGKNCALYGKLNSANFLNNRLESGENLILEEVEE
ncbi:MAG: glucose-1-phosphate adenylyltransferase [Firmicutes bacterium HGW-Firmicutes-1]|jgi:glucose-1-phosphate adenylyltransferase|nr:MAG: glucose-1-phosphate adenylyltransferase [Firmicutes bacterium HGW-Firmicutes-1]